MYREYQPREAGSVYCTWERASAQGEELLVIPDGCVDVLWFSDGRLEIAGPDTGSWVAEAPEEIQISGVRLRPGTAARVFGQPASEITNTRVPLSSVTSFGGEEENLKAQLLASTPSRRVELLEAVVTLRKPDYDLLVMNAIGMFRRDPSSRVAALADDLGVSARNLHRRFVREVGYGPKMFARVVRLQSFIRSSDPRRDLADAAVAAGYASQSHLNDEFRALTSMTPVRFMEDRVKC